MCEHMRNISKDVSKIAVTKDKLNFFTKRLTEDEKSELLHVLTKVDIGYQIEWVALSIWKRRNYSESRADNRKKKTSEDMLSHDVDMDNENENKKSKINKVGKYPKPEDFNGLPEIKLGSAIQLMKITQGIIASEGDVNSLWEVFKGQNLTGKKFYASEDDVYSHFINWVKEKKVKSKETTVSQTIKINLK
jgi:hypothetical protein